MRLLFTSVSAIGHVNPMIPLALALKERGHEIRWVDGARRLPEAGVRGDRGDPRRADRGRLIEPSTRTAIRSGGGCHRPRPWSSLYPRLFGEIVAAALVEGVIDDASEWRPDLVVHDAAEFSGAIAAASIGVPSVTHTYGALTPISA